MPIAPSYAGADLVVVNTCGFIDAAVAESLDAIGEALAENGKVIVTGCLGAKDGGGFVRAAHPKVLAVTGPHAAGEVMAAVHAHLPQPHDPFADLVPPQGIKLTPRHYAYLKISEGCNHRCTFCIIPSLRGDLVSRPLGEVLAEAERLLDAGVKELLVISQDTSAYGVDVRYRTGFWQGRPLKTRMTELATALDTMARARGAWVRLHYVYPYPHVDEVIGRMTDDPAQGGLLPYLDVPFQHASPRILKLMKRPANAEGTLRRIEAWRAARPDLRPAQHVHRRLPRRDRSRVRGAAGVPRGGAARPRRLLRLFAGRRRRRQRAARSGSVRIREERRARFMAVQARISAARLARRIGATMTVLVDGHEGKTAIAPQRRRCAGDRRHRADHRRRCPAGGRVRAGDDHRRFRARSRRDHRCLTDARASILRLTMTTGKRLRVANRHDQTMVPASGDRPRDVMPAQMNRSSVRGANRERLGNMTSSSPSVAPSHLAKLAA